eukprot:jgi/Hompol1/384/HPOL_005304-RA
MPLAPHVLDYDITISEDTQKRDLMRKLMIYGYSAPLSNSQQHRVLRWIEEHPQFVHQVSLSPNEFAGLVENNPIIAAETLTSLVVSPLFRKFLNTLVEMATTIHSMEVVNRVASTVLLPSDFLHLYISKSIAECDTIRDKFIQNRQVRL